MKNKIIALAVLILVLVAVVSGCGNTHNCDCGVWVDEVPASCTAEGVAGHYHCDVCGKNYDKDKNEVSDITIAKLAHVYGDFKEGVPATCTEPGVYTYCTCSVCGHMFNESYEEIASETENPRGHSYGDLTAGKPAKCTEDGTASYYTCSVCGLIFDENHNELESIVIPATGHVFSEEDQNQYFLTCKCLVCNKNIRRTDGTTVLDRMTHDYDRDELEKVMNDADALADKINKLGKTAVSGKDSVINEFSEWLDSYDVISDAVYEYVIYRNAVYAVSYSEEDSDLSVEAENTFNDLVQKLKDVIAAVYDSPIKEDVITTEYFVQEDIDYFDLHIEEFRNIKITELNKEISEMETALRQQTYNKAYLQSYAQLVAKRQELAHLRGYDNYYDYAMKNVYGRSYDREMVDNVRRWTKQYIAPCYDKVYSSYNRTISPMVNSDKDFNYYQKIFTLDFKGIATIIEPYFAMIKDEEHGVDFLAKINDAFRTGSVLSGNRPGAYCTGEGDTRYMYFQVGGDYSSAFTFVHESGHYNFSEEDLYDDYDFFESHSQGNEAMFNVYIANYLKNNGLTKVSKFVTQYYLIDWVTSVIYNMICDEFEEAVYLDYYDGSDIFKDGITWDEYEKLYEEICNTYVSTDVAYGFSDIMDYYFVASSVYEISYSVSALPILDIYINANKQGLEPTIQQYLKLYTFKFDEEFYDKSTLSYEKILDYAGLESPFSEELYKKIYDYLK